MTSTAPVSAAARTAWMCASVLLDYPDEHQEARLPTVQDAIGDLPPELGRPLARFLGHRLAADPVLLAGDYVETFDKRRRCSLFLTYFAHGDTRKRGMALLRFKQTYLAAGVRLDDGELPDHLCVVLEFAASVDPDAGRQLLLDHRAGLEVLRLALRDQGSPWADLLEAVCATLPPLRGEEREAVRRLAADGPPEEEVGLAPYGVTGAVDLPMPALLPSRAPQPPGPPAAPGRSAR